MLLPDIMACGSQCYQRQYRRQGTKLDRYLGITKHRKERSLRGRMLLVTLQHDLTSTLDSGVQTDMIVLEFSKAFDRVPNIQFTREATPRWHQGIPNSRSNTSFLAEPSVAVESCSSERVHVFRGGGVLYVSVLGPLLFLLFILYICMCQILQTPLGEYLLLHCNEYALKWQWIFSQNNQNITWKGQSRKMCK